MAMNHLLNACQGYLNIFSNIQIVEWKAEGRLFHVPSYKPKCLGLTSMYDYCRQKNIIEFFLDIFFLIIVSFSHDGNDFETLQNRVKILLRCHEINHISSCTYAHWEVEISTIFKWYPRVFAWTFFLWKNLIITYHWTLHFSQKPTHYNHSSSYSQSKCSKPWHFPILHWLPILAYQAHVAQSCVNTNIKPM